VKLNSVDFFKFSSVTNYKKACMRKLIRRRPTSLDALMHFRVNFFSSSVVNVWNSLSESVSFVSLPVFKRTLSYSYYRRFK